MLARPCAGPWRGPAPAQAIWARRSAAALALDVRDAHGPEAFGEQQRGRATQSAARRRVLCAVWQAAAPRPPARVRQRPSGERWRLACRRPASARRRRCKRRRHHTRAAVVRDPGPSATTPPARPRGRPAPWHGLSLDAVARWPSRSAGLLGQGDRVNGDHASSADRASSAGSCERGLAAPSLQGFDSAAHAETRSARRQPSRRCVRDAKQPGHLGKPRARRSGSPRRLFPAQRACDALRVMRHTQTTAHPNEMRLSANRHEWFGNPEPWADQYR